MQRLAAVLAQRKGSTLLVVLVFFLLITALGVALLTASALPARAVRKLLSEHQATAYADSMARYCAAALAQGESDELIEEAIRSEAGKLVGGVELNTPVLTAHYSIERGSGGASVYYKAELFVKATLRDITDPENSEISVRSPLYVKVSAYYTADPGTAPSNNAVPEAAALARFRLDGFDSSPNWQYERMVSVIERGQAGDDTE